jgi:hypothetical protein
MLIYNLGFQGLQKIEQMAWNEHINCFKSIAIKAGVPFSWIPFNYPSRHYNVDNIPSIWLVHAIFNSYSIEGFKGCHIYHRSWRTTHHCKGSWCRSNLFRKESSNKSHIRPSHFFLFRALVKNHDIYLDCRFPFK